MAFSYHNNAAMVPFDEFQDQLMDLPSASIVPVYYQDGKQSKYSVVMGDNGEEFSSVTSKYKLAQHSDVMFKVLDAIQAAGIDGNARTKYFGGKCYMDMVFSNMKINDPTGNGKDISIGYTARNSYDSTSGVNLFPYAIRGACQNGMIFKMTPDLGLNIISIRHMGDIIEKVSAGIKTMMERTLRIQGVFVEMVDRASNNWIEFHGNELELTMTEFAGSSLAARKIIESSNLKIEGEITQWDIYNALTQYATHNAKSGNIYERIQQGAEKLLMTPNLSETRNQAVLRAQPIPLTV